MIGKLKAGALGTFSAVAVAGAISLGAECKPTPAPPLPSSVDGSDDSSGSLSAATIYSELVAGGCMAPDPDGGIAYVQKALVTSGQPSWLLCLAGGGSISSCNVPCKKP